MWMAHILDTMSYTAFCQKVCGQFVHHNPALNVSRQSSVDVGMMLGTRQNVSHLTKKIWGINYVPTRPIIRVFIALMGKMYTVNTTIDTTIRMLDKQIKSTTGKVVKMLFNGSTVSRTRTLEYYGVKDGDVIVAEKCVSSSKGIDTAMPALPAALST